MLVCCNVSQFNKNRRTQNTNKNVNVLAFLDPAVREYSDIDFDTSEISNKQLHTNSETVIRSESTENKFADSDNIDNWSVNNNETGEI